MKKTTMCILTAGLLLMAMPTHLKAENNPASGKTSKTIEPAQAKILLSRLDEINEMDKSNLSSPEKTQLRQEVRSIKQQLNNRGGGIYISVGAAIIILLLIIILL